MEPALSRCFPSRTEASMMSRAALCRLWLVFGFATVSSSLSGCLRLESAPYLQLGDLCDDSAECAPPLVCDGICKRATTSGSTCSTDVYCSSGYVCREGSCVSSVCDASSAPLVCLGATCDSGACRAPSLCGSYGCSPGYNCTVAGCLKPCTVDSACSRYRCDGGTSYCRTSCTDPSQCQLGSVCRDSFCVAG